MKVHCEDGNVLIILNVPTITVTYNRSGLKKCERNKSLLNNLVENSQSIIEDLAKRIGNIIHNDDY